MLAMGIDAMTSSPAANGAIVPGPEGIAMASPASQVVGSDIIGASTQPIDVFIGDSSATNFAADATTGNRWTKLLSDADGAREVSEAVGGTGFVVGSVPFDVQLDRVLSRLASDVTPASAVRRVLVVGGGNDMAAVGAGKVSQEAVTEAYDKTLGRVAEAFPSSQLIYIPEVSPATSLMMGRYEGMAPYMDGVYAAARAHGFTTDEAWISFVPDADTNGTAAADKVHLSAKGHNVAATALARWLDGLGGEKVPYDVAKWPDGAPSKQDTQVTGSVILDGNGYALADGRLNAYTSQKVTLPVPPSRQGYRFVGWCEDRDGNGALRAAGESVGITGSNATLYAMWGEAPAGNGNEQAGNQNQDQDQNQNGDAGGNENGNAGESGNGNGNSPETTFGNVTAAPLGAETGKGGTVPDSEEGTGKTNADPDAARTTRSPDEAVTDSTTESMRRNRETVMSETGDGMFIAIIPAAIGVLVFALVAVSVRGRRNRR